MNTKQYKSPKVARRMRRKRGLRKRIIGVPDRPRLSVFRSNRHFYAQVIDDLAGRTLASASTKEKGSDETPCNCTVTAELGKKLAERARKAGVEAVVFDRAGFRYHGRIKAFADGVRAGGLKF
jgi:large subunit ribosomal protein L18